MLLSRANLDRLEEQPKLDRIKLYVQDQRDQFPYERSPGRVSIPESCINDDPEGNDEGFSASISEIILQKRQGPRLDASSSKMAIDSKLDGEKQRHQDSVSPSVQKRKRMKPDDTIKAPTSKALPQSNGFHLLQKFVSPNLEINRITIKSGRHRPKLGLFNKGKSSANGKPVPDLVFSESQFLKPRPQPPVSHISVAKSPEAFSSSRSRQPSISRFFPPKPRENKPPLSTSPLRKQPPPPASVLQTSIFAPSIANRPQGIQDLFSQQQRNTTPTSPQVQSRYQGDPTVPENRSLCSSSSFESIQRLLKECQHPTTHYTTTYPQYSAKSQQVPCYSRVKSPYGNPATIRDRHMPWPSNVVFYSPNASTFHYNHQARPRQKYSNDDNSSDNPPAQKHPRRASTFGLNWQVVDSVVSFNHAKTYANQREKDDLDCILESSVINMINRSNDKEDNDLQNFWLTQSYKRKL